MFPWLCCLLLINTLWLIFVLVEIFCCFDYPTLFYYPLIRRWITFQSRKIVIHYSKLKIEEWIWSKKLQFVLIFFRIHKFSWEIILHLQILSYFLSSYFKKFKYPFSKTSLLLNIYLKLPLIESLNFNFILVFGYL